MRDDVAAVEPASRATTSWGTPAVDVGAGVRAQLERDRVAVVDLSSCTRESPDLFSYRRDGRASGRQAGVIRIAS
jgi:copper oxidase (laccase) domain-containing protein